jgi:peptidoglycan hydrolase CwlO-like protein
MILPSKSSTQPATSTAVVSQPTRSGTMQSGMSASSLPAYAASTENATLIEALSNFTLQLANLTQKVDTLQETNTTLLNKVNNLQADNERLKATVQAINQGTSESGFSAKSSQSFLGRIESWKSRMSDKFRK